MYKDKAHIVDAGFTPPEEEKIDESEIYKFSRS